MGDQAITPFWEENSALIALCRALDYDVRLVGGCVRDAVLKKKVSDIDLATPLTPDEVMDCLTRAGINVVPTGLKFGTVTAVIEAVHYEITTLRKDISCDGRHAQVTFTKDYEEDAQRRDFTMNAMSCDLTGKIYDYCGGWQDTVQGKVRFVGKALKRCEEDILRILRFFRFYAYYGMGPADQEALHACKELAPRIENLSGERIQSEMVKLLIAPHPFITLQMMDQQGVLPYILGRSPSRTCWKALEHQLNYETHYYLPMSPWLRLSHLLEQLEDVHYLTQRWKLSHAHREVLHALLSVSIPAGTELSKHYPFVRKYGKSLYAAMVRRLWARTQEAQDIAYRGLLTGIEQWEVPVFPLKGADLIVLGIAPGKQMGVLLKQTESWWEETGYQADRRQLLAQVHRLLQR